MQHKKPPDFLFDDNRASPGSCIQEEYVTYHELAGNISTSEEISEGFMQLFWSVWVSESNHFVADITDVASKILVASGLRAGFVI